MCGTAPPLSHGGSDIWTMIVTGDRPYLMLEVDSNISYVDLCDSGCMNRLYMFIFGAHLASTLSCHKFKGLV